MKSNCTSRSGRFCYFKEICPDGPNQAPVAGQKASTTEMWLPIVTSDADPSPDWVQGGIRQGGGMCIKHTAYEPVNTPGSWMVTDAVEVYKEVYACCPRGENLPFNFQMKLFSKTVTKIVSYILENQ